MEEILKGKKVLVVEDDISMLNSLDERLAREGCAVLRAEDGDAAVVLAGKEHPDIILLDIIIPYKSGLDVLKDIRTGSDWGKQCPSLSSPTCLPTTK